MRKIVAGRNTMIRAFSVMLLLVFLQILTPGVYIHEFFGHEDTTCHPGANCSLEPAHHHCAILKLTADHFLHPDPCLFPKIRIHYRLLPECVTSTVYDNYLIPGRGRAPPAV